MIWYWQCNINSPLHLISVFLASMTEKDIKYGSNGKSFARRLNSPVKMIKKKVIHVSPSILAMIHVQEIIKNCHR